MSIWVALSLITLCAVLWDISIVLQKLAVDQVPTIKLDHTFPAALRSLAQSRKWMAGFAASAAGWGLFVLALAWTPLSVARAMQGSGFVILAVFSLLFLRHRLSVREWIGVALVTSGIVGLGMARGSSGSISGEISVWILLTAFSACLLICAAAYAVPRMIRIGPPGVIVFSIIAGTLLGFGDASTKVLLVVLQRHGFGFPAAAAGVGLIVCYLSGFLVLSRAYQHGRAILVTAVSDLCSRLVSIFIGFMALGESLAGDPRLRVYAVLGYVGILGGVIFLSRFSGEEIADGIKNAQALRSREGLETDGHAQEGERPTAARIDADD